MPDRISEKMPGENIRIDAREASNRIMRELNARKGCQQIYAIYFQMRCQNLRQTNVTVWISRSKIIFAALHVHFQGLGNHKMAVSKIWNIVQISYQHTVSAKNIRTVN